MANFDPSEFFRNARRAGDAGMQAALLAVNEFGEHVLGQAEALAPVGGGSHSPRDPAPGTLQASGTSEPAEITSTGISKTIGFNTEYAAVQHEDLEFEHDQGQAKYLEQPIQENQPKLAPFVAERMKAAIEGA
jgi:hypothetical protein